MGWSYSASAASFFCCHEVTKRCWTHRRRGCPGDGRGLSPQWLLSLLFWAEKLKHSFSSITSTGNKGAQRRRVTRDEWKKTKRRIWKRETQPRRGEVIANIAQPENSSSIILQALRALLSFQLFYFHCSNRLLKVTKRSTTCSPPGLRVKQTRVFIHSKSHKHQTKAKLTSPERRKPTRLNPEPAGSWRGQGRENDFHLWTTNQQNKTFLVHMLNFTNWNFNWSLFW